MGKWSTSSLQNGSDIRGVALEGVENEPVTLTPEIVRTIGYAFAQWLAGRLGRTGLRVSVGHDSRLSAAFIKRAVFEGLEQAGCIAFDCGLASTPAMFMSTVFENHAYDGSVMLTASHLPFNRNGLKFFTRTGGLEKEDIQAILSLAEEKGDVAAKPLQQTWPIELMADYTAHLVQVIRSGTGVERPLDALRIVVDAGNGVGGFFVQQVLQPLGAETTGSRFLEPDGSFPNHIPNPEDQDAMDAIISAVKESRADFGIIFDTDVDRAGAVDRNGQPINRNRFIALMSMIVLEEHPGTTIVTDSVTSSGLKWWIEEHLGGVHHRFKRGYRNVISEAIRLNVEGTETQLALETSGHGALKENFFLDDGAYQIAKILIKIARLKVAGERDISQLIAALPEPAEALEMRPQILAEEFAVYAEEILEAFKAFVRQQDGWCLTPNNFEGVHVTCNQGWILLRRSLHDPQLPINIESDVPGGAEMLKERTFYFLSRFEHLSLPED